jgi:hypothetical protein
MFRNERKVMKVLSRITSLRTLREASLACSG